MTVLIKGKLNVEPSNELEFYGPFTSVQISKISLTNPTEDAITFKIKTTVPKRYCVRPSCGIVLPNEKTDVSVMLQPFDCDVSEKNKHKFMIQSMVLDNINETNLELLWKEADLQKIHDTRLKCVLKLAEDQLKIEPSELIFNGSAGEASTIHMNLTNTGNEDVVFKVKTNTVKRYTVFPNDGIISAKQTKQLTVSTGINPQPSGELKEKLIFMVAIAAEYKNLPPDQIWNRIDRNKIYEKVVICSIRNSSMEQGVLDNAKTLSQEIANLRKENLSLREAQTRLGRLGGDSPTSIGASNFEQMGLFRKFNIPPIVYILVTFLIALLIGKFVV